MKRLIVLTLILLITSCQVQKENEGITVQLKWFNQAQFAGNYVADAKGFYDEVGLNVTNKEFDFINWPIESVQNKESDFGITGADELIIAKSNGVADDVVAVAVVFRVNPVVLYTLADSGIDTPNDFVGKTIGIESGSDGKDINVGILYKAMMKKLGINREDVDEVTIGYDASELLSGETDISSGYIINEPYGVIEDGKEVKTFLVANYGINMYADVIITHSDMISENPDIIKKYLDATFRGWQYAIENEGEAVSIVIENMENADQNHQTYMLSQSIPLINSGNMKLGVMRSADWNDAVSLLKKQGIITNDVSVDSLYDNRFIS